MGALSNAVYICSCFQLVKYQKLCLAYSVIFVVQSYEAVFEECGYDSLPHLVQASHQVLDEIAEDLQMKVLSQSLYRGFFFVSLIGKIYLCNFTLICRVNSNPILGGTSSSFQR